MAVRGCIDPGFSASGNEGDPCYPDAPHALCPRRGHRGQCHSGGLHDNGRAPCAEIVETQSHQGAEETFFPEGVRRACKIGVQDRPGGLHCIPDGQGRTGEHPHPGAGGGGRNPPVRGKGLVQDLVLYVPGPDPPGRPGLRLSALAA